MEVITPTTCTSSTCSCLENVVQVGVGKGAVPGLFHPVVAGRRGQLGNDLGPPAPFDRVRREVAEFPVIGGVGVADKDHHPSLSPKLGDLLGHKGDDLPGLGPHIQGAPGVQEIIEHIRHDQGHLTHGRLLITRCNRKTIICHSERSEESLF